MYDAGKAAQVSRELNNYRCTILGLSEVKWTGFGKVKLTSGETIIISGRDDNVHREGVTIMMSIKAEKALMEWKPINERIITARFFSKLLKQLSFKSIHRRKTVQKRKKTCFRQY